MGSDLTSLLRDLNSGNTSAAKADLSKVQAQAAPTLPGNLGSDLTSLLKDLNSGNTPAAKEDVGKVQADLQTQDASSVASAQTGGPLDVPRHGFVGSQHALDFTTGPSSLNLCTRTGQMWFVWCSRRL
jgi:hypothetical protein